MTMLRRPGLTSRWLVNLCLLFALLAPAASQALAWARGDALAWSQVCRSSVVAPRAEKIDAGQAEQDPAHGLLAHCPCCGLQAQDLAPPPATALPPLQLLPLHFEMPARFYSAPQGAHVWRPAQSRAPPPLA
ncbi:DUF2946 family protein [Paucibacter soli]|uniref:DUF2946 family protein n=1 Tax=Paucibacter soli TaxID=3133433 RepID=UPI0030AB91A5